MPAEPPPNLLENDILEVTFLGLLFDQVIMNVLHYRLSVVSASDLISVYQDLFDAVNDVTSVRGKLLLAVAPEYSLKRISIQAVSKIRFARFYFASDHAGTRLGTCKTADIAAVIEKSSFFATSPEDTPNRGQHGSFHLAGLSDQDISAALLGDAYRTGPVETLANALTEVLTGAVGNEYVPVLYHRDDVSIAPWTDIISSDVKGEVRVMRRRTWGRGI